MYLYNSYHDSYHASRVNMWNKYNSGNKLILFRIRRKLCERNERNRTFKWFWFWVEWLEYVTIIFEWPSIGQKSSKIMISWLISRVLFCKIVHITFINFWWNHSWTDRRCASLCSATNKKLVTFLFWTATKTNYISKCWMLRFSKEIDWYHHHQQFLFKRSIFQTFWKPDSCPDILFFELDSSNFEYLYIF